MVISRTKHAETRIHTVNSGALRLAWVVGARCTLPPALADKAFLKRASGGRSRYLRASRMSVTRVVSTGRGYVAVSSAISPSPSPKLIPTPSLSEVLPPVLLGGAVLLHREDERVGDELWSSSRMSPEELGEGNRVRSKSNCDSGPWVRSAQSFTSAVLVVVRERDA